MCGRMEVVDGLLAREARICVALASRSKGV